MAIPSSESITFGASPSPGRASTRLYRPHKDAMPRLLIPIRKVEILIHGRVDQSSASIHSMRLAPVFLVHHVRKNLREMMKEHPNKEKECRLSLGYGLGSTHYWYWAPNTNMFMHSRDWDFEPYTASQVVNGTGKANGRLSNNLRVGVNKTFIPLSVLLGKTASEGSSLCK